MKLQVAVQQIIARVSVCVLFFVFPYASFPQVPQVKKCGFITAGKLRIYYCEQGQGSAVIFLHAGFLDMRQWDRQVTMLAGDHRVITLDLPGHGQSTGIDTTIRIAEVINLVMNRLQVRSASFVGMSLGAACAVDFAITHPEKTTRLLLCSPGLNGWQDVMKMDTMSKRLFMRDDIFADTKEPELISENFVHFWLDGPYRKTAQVDSSVRGYIFRATFAKLTSKKGSGPVFDRKTAARRVQLIHKPVLILYGNLDIPFVANISRYLQKKIKGSQLKIIEGGAHLFNFEKPELFETHLKSWIK